MLIFRNKYWGKFNIVGMGGGIVVGSGDVDHSVVLGFVRWGMRWLIFRWCVGEVAIYKFVKPQ